MVQWLGLCASTVGGMGSIPGPGTKMPQATQPKKKKNKTKKQTNKNHYNAEKSLQVQKSFFKKPNQLTKEFSQLLEIYQIILIHKPEYPMVEKQHKIQKKT